MPKTCDLVEFCDQRTKRLDIPDFTGAYNGLQIENSGEVTKIGAAVDAGLFPFRKAIQSNIDFLIVHHGLFWTPPIPMVGNAFEKTKICFENNLAVYGSHLPLDCHPEIGNNALLAKKLNLIPKGGFLPYEGTDVGLLTQCSYDLNELKERLIELFPEGLHSLCFGSKKPQTIAILTGSGQSAVNEIRDAGADTLITGELKQHHFNIAQEMNLNLFLCGHYATETFGVKALAREAAEAFDLPYEFVEMNCPL